VSVQAIGKSAGVVRYRVRVEYAVALLPVASVVSRWHHDAALARAQTLQQPLIPQSTSQLVATRNRGRDGWPQTKVGRGIEEDNLPHHAKYGVLSAWSWRSRGFAFVVQHAHVLVDQFDHGLAGR
jgi:hypothetical protein